MISKINNISAYFAKFKNSTLTESEFDILASDFADIISQPSICWLSYLDSTEKQQIVPIHNNYNTADGIFSKASVSGGIVLSIQVNLNSNTIVLTPSTFLYISTYLIDKALPSLPSIDASSDKNYAIRDYNQMFNSLVQLISLVSPDLTLLITDRNSPDFYVLDALSYIYDRLQFYIDYATSLHNIETSTGEFLESIANFYGVNPPAPTPSTIKFPISIVLKMSSSDETVPTFPDKLTLSLNNLKNIPDIYTTIKTTNGTFQLKNSSSIELIKSLDAEANTVEYVGSSYISYIDAQEKTRYETIDLSTAREIYIRDRYVDIESVDITIPDLDPNNYEIYKITDISQYPTLLKKAIELKELIENGVYPTNYVFITALIRTNRYGETIIRFLNPLFVQSTEFTFKISYNIHRGSEANNAEFSGKEKTISVSGTDILNYLSFSGNTPTLKDTSTLTIEYKKPPDNNYAIAAGGTIPISDDELRQILLYPFESSDYFTAAPYDLLKRTVVEEDYFIILKLSNFSVLTAKVVPIHKINSSDIDSFVSELSEDFYYQLDTAKKILIFPYFVEILVVKKNDVDKDIVLPSGKIKTKTLHTPTSFTADELIALNQLVQSHKMLHHYSFVTNANIKTVNITGTIYAKELDMIKEILYDIQNSLTFKIKIGEKVTSEKVMSEFLKHLENAAILDLNINLPSTVSYKDLISINVDNIKIEDISKYSLDTAGR